MKLLIVFICSVVVIPILFNSICASCLDDWSRCSGWPSSMTGLLWKPCNDHCLGLDFFQGVCKLKNNTCSLLHNETQVYFCQCNKGDRRGAYGKVCNNGCKKVENRNYYLCNTEPFTDSYGRTRTSDLCSPHDGLDAYGGKCIEECKVDERYGERYCHTNEDRIHFGANQCSISAY